MKKKEYSFLKETRGLFIFAVITSGLLSLAYIGIAYFMKVLIDAGNAGDKEKIFGLAWKSVLYLILYFAVGQAQTRAMNAFSKAVIRSYKKDRLSRIINIPFSEFTKKDVGTYISSLTNNANIVFEGLGKGTITIIRLLLQILFVIIVMIFMNWQLFAITVGVFIVPLLVSVVSNKSIVKLNSLISKKNSVFVAGLKDFLGGYGIIKSFRAEKEAMNPIYDSIDELEETKEKIGNKTDALEINSNTAVFLGTILIFIIGALQVINGKLTIGNLIAYLQLLFFIQYPVDILPGHISKYLSARELVHEDFIDTEAYTVKEQTIETIEDKVEIKDLYFSYDNEKTIINGINMELEKNKLYAIVGTSGSGKSTLINLLRGYFDNYTGSINLDGKSIRDISNVYDVFTVIDQSVFIFNSTIANNICMYKDFTDEEINRAVELAGLSKLVKEKGLDYQCGENGINLSGGERQRISIARALISKKKFIAMDESTSSLDIVTARAIEQTIDDLDGVLRLVITHNLNETFLRKCDKIFVMKNGRIVESGLFDELIEKKKTLYSMLELWQ